MSSFLLTNFIDASRSLGPDPFKATPESVSDWFEQFYLTQRGGGFNYDPASFAAYDLFRGATSKEAATQFCATKGNPKGRDQNASAARAIADYALANVSTCYRIGFMAVEVGRTRGVQVFVGIKAPFVRVRGRDARLVVPGFRMSHRPTEVEIDVACGIAKAHLARDDYADADVEYLYAGPGYDGKRSFRAIVGRDRKIPSLDEIDQLLQVYVQGITMLIDRGIAPSAPSFRGYKRRSFEEPTFV
jgi:hypothetical protein